MVSRKSSNKRVDEHTRTSFPGAGVIVARTWTSDMIISSQKCAKFKPFHARGNVYIDFDGRGNYTKMLPYLTSMTYKSNSNPAEF
jgi:hypothetical protein